MVETAKGADERLRVDGCSADGCSAGARPVVDMLEGTAFRHGFTYNGHPVGAAVALANLEIIEREGLIERASVGARMLSSG